jgi:uncharacterized protein YndB with AHSA1/START domain
MNKYGIITEPGTIRFERLLPGPAGRVWAYLTESEKKGKWLAAGEIEPRSGGKVELRFRHRDLSAAVEPVPEKYKYMENGISFTGRVTKWDPPHLLSYTWGEPDGSESEVTFELTPKGDKVLLILTHRRLGVDPAILISVSSGWHTHLGILADRLEGNEPRGFWQVHNELEKEYGQIIGEAGYRL